MRGIDFGIELRSPACRAIEFVQHQRSPECREKRWPSAAKKVKSKRGLVAGRVGLGFGAAEEELALALLLAGGVVGCKRLHAVGKCFEVVETRTGVAA